MKVMGQPIISAHAYVLQQLCRIQIEAKGRASSPQYQCLFDLSHERGSQWRQHVHAARLLAQIRA